MATIFALVAVALLSSCSSDTGTIVIRAVSLVPSTTPFTEDFRAWIVEVNERAAGSFKIVYVGGPEAVPSYEQADALRTGVVHLVFGPTTYYLGNLPEVGALFASNLSPAQTRANGGLALMDRLHRERLGARFLGRAFFMEFHVYTRAAPVLDGEGLPVFSNLKLRGGAIWREFITKFGGVFINLAPSDIYTALERGTIDGVGWPIHGLQDTSWDRHLKYRIDPGVFSSDVGILFNTEKWDSLPPSARTLLEQAIAEYEHDSYERFRDQVGELDVSLRDGGMQIIDLDPAAAERYRTLAADVIWDRIEKYAPQHYAELREKFYREPTRD